MSKKLSKEILSIFFTCFVVACPGATRLVPTCAGLRACRSSESICCQTKEKRVLSKFFLEYFDIKLRSWQWSKSMAHLRNNLILAQLLRNCLNYPFFADLRFISGRHVRKSFKAVSNLGFKGFRVGTLLDFSYLTAFQ